MFVAPFELARFDEAFDCFFDEAVTVFDVGKANFFGEDLGFDRLVVFTTYIVEYQLLDFFCCHFFFIHRKSLGLEPAG